MEVEDQSGCRGLGAAAVSGRMDLVNLLLEHKAKIDGRGYFTCATALMHAARKGKTEVVECLLGEVKHTHLIHLFFF